jgi:hypothetical protein
MSTKSLIMFLLLLGYFFISKMKMARRQWLVPIILATQEAEIRRIAVQSQPGQVC